MSPHPKLLSFGLCHEPGNCALCGRAAKPLMGRLVWERIQMHWTLCGNEVFLDQPKGLGIALSQGGFSDVNQNQLSSSSNNLVYFVSFCTLTFNTITFLGPKAAVLALFTNHGAASIDEVSLRKSRSSYRALGISNLERLISFEAFLLGWLCRVWRLSHRYLNYSASIHANSNPLSATVS